MTEYVVFSNTDAGGPRWIEAGRYSARSAASAIRQHLDEQMADETFSGKFAAVPTRSWQPVTVDVETETRLKFS